MEPDNLPGSPALRSYVTGSAEAPPDLPSDFAAALQKRREARDAARGGDATGRPLATHPAVKAIYGVHDAIARLPAPGGIALLVLILVVLLMVLVPVTSDRETRLSLLFGVIAGSKRIKRGTNKAGTGIQAAIDAANKAVGTSPAPGTGSGMPKSAPMILPLMGLDLPSIGLAALGA